MKLNELEKAIISNYQLAKLEYEKKFNHIWYKNLIKKMFGKFEKFEIQKSVNDCFYEIYFETNRNDICISLTGDTLYINISTKQWISAVSERLYYINVNFNIERLTEIKNKLIRS